MTYTQRDFLVDPLLECIQCSKQKHITFHSTTCTAKEYGNHSRHQAVKWSLKKKPRS